MAATQPPQQQPQTHLGVTKPITLAGPSPKEEAATEALLEELRRRNNYESEEEAKTRELVLGRLYGLVTAFVQKVSLTRGLSESAAAAARGKIFTFGSYRLGVHGPGADLDTLIVFPKHVTREDFFSEFEPMLREFEGVSEVTPVPEAYVPIIKTKISGIEIDLLCARLALANIPEDLELRDDSILKSLDERCIRSLNGSRVTDEILRLVPNVPVFREALRCIKLWAKRRAIYSNVMGFLGGVAWAMLVARICQLYPNQCAAAIIQKFFTIMHQWMWPQPVLLKQIEDGPLNVRVWNPKLYPADRLHRMPIITPAYPSMCSTHNVTASTQEIMTQEFRRGAEIVDRIMKEGAPWSELFEKHDFFSRYRYYIQVVASGNSAETIKKWSGTVESKIRQLVMKLEYVESLKLAHPFVKPFEHVWYCVNDEEAHAVAFSTVPDVVANRKEEDIKDIPGAKAIYTSTFYIGLGIAPKQPGATGPRKLDITYPTNDFKKMTLMWENFDISMMDIHITHLRGSALPSWVFDGGVRPQPKATKRSKPGKTSPNGQATDLPNKRIKPSLDHPASSIPGRSPIPLASTPAPNGTNGTLAPGSSAVVPDVGGVRSPSSFVLETA